MKKKIRSKKSRKQKKYKSYECIHKSCKWKCFDYLLAKQTAVQRRVKTIYSHSEKCRRRRNVVKSLTQLTLLIEWSIKWKELLNKLTILVCFKQMQDDNQKRVIRYLDNVLLHTLSQARNILFRLTSFRSIDIICMFMNQWKEVFMYRLNYHCHSRFPTNIRQQETCDFKWNWKKCHNTTTKI